MRVWESSHSQTSTPSTFFFLMLDLLALAFCGLLKLVEVVQNQYWPSAKSFINSLDMLQDYCNLKLKASEGHEMHQFSQNSFAHFPLRGDRCGEIPVEVDVGKISSGFSMNINEFSQLATSHICENVCLQDNQNTAFPSGLRFEFGSECGRERRVVGQGGALNVCCDICNTVAPALSD